MRPFTSPYNTSAFWRVAIGQTALAAAAAVVTLSAHAQTAECGALAAAAPPGVTLKTEAIAGNTTRPPGTSTGDLLAAHCVALGRMTERTGADGKPYYIGFELRLPSQWNGRFLYQGGGGNDGIVQPAIGARASTGYALNQGFAVVSTDAGHQGPSAIFGLDPIARTDNAYNAHDKVAVLAKELVRTYYAKPADKSYFIGCSGGGRQGMMFTQRFPSYFDGVIAIAPAMRVSRGATIAAAWDSQALMSIAPAAADGKKILSQALTNGDLQLLGKGILDACDAQDGVVDGMVSNPAACKFDPDPARMDAHSWIFDTAQDAQLTAFKARGGKLLFAHGLADPIFSPNDTIDYYQRATATQGAPAPDFARLFLIPGMGHCSGGAATDRWDGLGALVDWVEKGSAPERIVATGSSVFPGRSRPLCAHPRHAQYNGSGNIEDAANFSCR